MQLKLALAAFAAALLNRNSQEDIESAIDDLHDKLMEEFVPPAPVQESSIEPVQVPAQPPAVEAPAPVAATEAPAQDTGSAPTTA